MLMIRRIAVALLCACLSLAAPALAQISEQTTTSNGPDYDAWRNFAQQAEDLIDNRNATGEELAALRIELVAFRARFLAAQDANQTRIASLRDQIAALGPPPEEGATEAPEISERRAELAEQLAALQAPGIAAQEAFRRADGLIRQIDTTLRERDAEALLTLWPSPVNPVSWVAAVDAIWGTGFTFGTQILGLTEDPARMREFRSNLPVALLLILVSGFVLIRGRRWIEQLVSQWLTDGGSRHGRRVLARLLSLTQIILPVIAVMAIATALELSSVLGMSSEQVTVGLIAASAAYFTARWAGRQAFTIEDSRSAALQLPAARRREGRFWVNMIGVVVAISVLLREFFPIEDNSDAANAVLAFPIIALIGLVLVRIGMLLGHHNKIDDELAVRETRFTDRIIYILGKVSMLIGISAPILAAIGYVQAAEAMLYPAIGSLGLIVGLLFLMQLDEDIYSVLSKSEENPDTALIPSLINFALVILSIPLFAMIWGVRPTELLEFWQTLQEGFRIGETRISPTNILSFVIVFSIGYLVTRVLQGGLESSVLPKTRIDKGGQKAIISGVGYVGIFAAALIAISTAGIDLSGLAIVAGALSVGIGFGLQNIVSNFISGLILLIERPVAEGDWIEVGGTMGTVRSISVRSTVIETFDRTDVIVPNADLIQGTVINWTRYNSLGRITIPVGVAYGSDTRKVARILKEIGENEPLALIDPAPQVHFMEFGADSLDFELRLVLSDVNFGVAVRTELRHQIVERFKEEGIEIPFAQRDVWLRNPEVLRGEPVQPEPEPERDPRDAKARTEMVRDDIVDASPESGDSDSGR
ncbi:MAG: mechanosensitive ion channel family protein [Rhodobacteraceae bacterium]|nr:MAG: mechanosensitive ion channel family protein [Paracoccaceae bacterium]